MENVTVRFDYLSESYNLTFESDVLYYNGAIDDDQAKVLISFVLSHIPSRSVCVYDVKISSKEKDLYTKEQLCYYHIGKEDNI